MPQKYCASRSSQRRCFASVTLRVPFSSRIDRETLLLLESARHGLRRSSRGITRVNSYIVIRALSKRCLTSNALAALTVRTHAVAPRV